MRVEWDEDKNRINRRKHRLSFERARELFASGSDYLEIFDAVHSDLEDRFLAIGPIDGGLVVVSWTEREDDTRRIISARWATKREQAMLRAYFGDPA